MGSHRAFVVSVERSVERSVDVLRRSVECSAERSVDVLRRSVDVLRRSGESATAQL